MRTVLSHFVAGICALFWALRHHRGLNVRASECLCYYRKSLFLALSYVGLCRHNNVRNLAGAGLAGFLCCAYDVVTDWRSFEPDSYNQFRDLLTRHVSRDLQRIALSLYEKDRLRTLEDDGLERGAIALHFILPLMGSLAEVNRELNLQALGRSCQIVDDILDFEEDAERRELNCLLSPNAQNYLDSFVNEFPADTIYRLFGRRTVLSKVFITARRKAHSMRQFMDIPSQHLLQSQTLPTSLRGSAGSCSTCSFKQVPGDPYEDVGDEQAREIRTHHEFRT